ncbi:hypothetical protein MNV49_000281 [Pseudohyphozyma bogoriensis]|nr:hypothetical protein MNV49_000281 [Pseudohyphozyma bogoriensis]
MKAAPPPEPAPIAQPTTKAEEIPPPKTLFGSLWAKTAQVWSGASAEEEIPPTGRASIESKRGGEPAEKVPEAKIEPFEVDPTGLAEARAEAARKAKEEEDNKPKQSTILNSRPLPSSAPSKKATDPDSRPPVPPRPPVEPITWHRPPPIHPRDFTTQLPQKRRTEGGEPRTAYDWLHPADMSQVLFDPYLFHPFYSTAIQATYAQPSPLPASQPFGAPAPQSFSTFQPPPWTVSGAAVPPGGTAALPVAGVPSSAPPAIVSPTPIPVPQPHFPGLEAQQTPQAFPSIAHPAGTVPATSPMPSSPPSATTAAALETAAVPAGAAPAPASTNPSPPSAPIEASTTSPVQQLAGGRFMGVAMTPAAAAAAAIAALQISPAPTPPPASGAPAYPTSSPINASASTPAPLPPSPSPRLSEQQPLANVESAASTPLPAGSDVSLNPAPTNPPSLAVQTDGLKPATIEVIPPTPLNPTPGRQEAMSGHVALDAKTPGEGLGGGTAVTDGGGSTKDGDGVPKEAFEEEEEEEEEEELAPKLDLPLTLDWSLPDLGFGDGLIAGEEISKPSDFFSSLGGPSSTGFLKPTEESDGHLPFPERSASPSFQLNIEDVDEGDEDNYDEEDDAAAPDIEAAFDATTNFVRTFEDVASPGERDHDSRMGKWLAQQGVTPQPITEFKALPMGDEESENGSMDANLGLDPTLLGPSTYRPRTAPPSTAPPITVPSYFAPAAPTTLVATLSKLDTPSPVVSPAQIRRAFHSRGGSLNTLNLAGGGGDAPSPTDADFESESVLTRGRAVSVSTGEKNMVFGGSIVTVKDEKEEATVKPAPSPVASAAPPSTIPATTSASTTPSTLAPPRLAPSLAPQIPDPVDESRRAQELKGRALSALSNSAFSLGSGGMDTSKSAPALEPNASEEEVKAKSEMESLFATW